MIFLTSDMIFLGYAVIRKTRHASRSIVLSYNLEFYNILCVENEIKCMKIIDIVIRSVHGLSFKTL